MQRPLVLGSIVLLLLGLPLLGVYLSGRPVDPYLEFPPRTRYVDHAPFSWPVFVSFALAIIATLTLFALTILRRLASESPPRSSSCSRRRSFPWWGWLGLAWTLIAWILAWNRFAWMASLQAYTFTFLWIGYILIVNSWTRMRGGTSLMVERPATFAWLFVLSAALWWFFEYLNRFVQNWYYSGVGELSWTDYIAQATIPFSTVLPAMVSTYNLLATVPQLAAGLDRGVSCRHCSDRRFAWIVLILAGGGLTSLAVWPNALFPLVWIAPLLVIVSLQTIGGEPTILEPLRHGDWRSLWVAAVAALICGIFWELWNWKSLAHWAYAIPYVDRYHIFAMPLLGYAGYLPFGLECLAVAQLILKNTGGAECASHLSDSCYNDSHTSPYRTTRPTDSPGNVPAPSTSKSS